MQQMSQCLFITLSWKLVSASHRLVLPVSTCFLVLALVRTGPPHEVGLKPDAQKLLRSDCYSCKWLQCFSLFGRWEGGCEEEEEERERERRGEINCKRPRWSSLIQQVQPWSSEERVFCWESCCWSTARFSRPQWSGSRWKKVENNKMWKEFKWCECCVSVMNCFTYLKSVFLVLLLSFAQISDSPNSTFLLSLVTQIHLGCCCRAASEADRRYRPGAQLTEGTASPADRWARHVHCYVISWPWLAEGHFVKIYC